jgi:uncharacterized membrane protein
MWINHHTVFHQIARVDRTYLTINVLFLMVIAFVPFPTRVLATHLQHDAKAAAFFYGVTMVVMAAMYGALWFYAAAGGRLLHEDADPRVVSGISRSFLPGVPLYALAMLSALISSVACRRPLRRVLRVRERALRSTRFRLTGAFR